MSTYRMTPAERRARVQARIQTRENRSLYNNYLKQQEEYEEQVKQQELESVWAENDKNSQSFLTRTFHTIGDIAANVITGAVKGLEGIYDLGAGIVGAVGGIFDEGFQDRVKEHIAYNWTMETFGNDWQEATKYSFTNDGKVGEIIENVANGIGQMLPSVAVSVATGGLGAPAAVAQAAPLATLGVSAAGNSTEEAFNDGASYYGGLGYGLASGAVEVATEKMFGGATESLFGKGVADNLVKKSVADTGIKRILKNAAEEGIEEMTSEAVNPLLKTIYKGKDAFEDYSFTEHLKEIGEAGLVGSLTALAYSGSVGYGMSKMGVGYVGSEADINESLMEIETQKKKAENLFANDKLTQVNDSQISSNIQENYKTIEKTLQKASEKKRASLIKKFSLDSAFDESGAMKSEFATKLGLVENVEQVDTQGQENSSTRLASLLKKEYYSPSLRGNEAEIETDLTNMTEQLRADETKLAQEEGRQAREVSEIKPFTGELTEKGKQNYSKTKKAVNYLNNKSGKSINLVVVESHDFINADIVDDRTIYIGADTFENDTWAGAIVHEYTHFAEGTKEYVKLVDYLQKDVKLFSDAFNSFVKRGYANGEMINSINEKIAKGETLTEQEQTYKDNLINSRTFRSEMGAIMSEQLLGSETFIDNIVSQESSIAEKVMKKIKDLKGMFERLGNAEARAEYKRLAKAEKLYLKAIEKAGYKYRNGKILARRDSDEIDSTSQNEYNNSEIQSSRKESALWESLTKQEQAQLYQRIDALHHSNYTEYRLRSGNYLLDIENKVIETNGNFDSPSVEGYVEFNKFSSKISIARDYFYDQVNNGRTIRESVEYINEVCQEEVATLHGYDDSQNNRVVGKQGRNNKSNRENSGRNGRGRKGTQSNKRAIRYNFESKEITYSDGTTTKFSLKENAEQEILDYYGKTYKWSETVYLFKDGTRLDGSGRVEGARGGYRTVDHRDIFDILTDSDTEGSEAMVEFMSRGNIRVMPETPGINLQVEPTEAQYKAIQDFVEREGFNEEYFSVDFDNANGDVIDNLEYEGRVSGRKVVADIKHYFKEGSLPYRSELSKFRYSRKENGQYYYQLSKGQIKKMFADNTGYKVYSKVDAEQIINNVLSNYMSFGDKYGEISGKTKKQVIDMLWQGLNSAKPGNQTSVALNIADYIIQNSVLESVYGDIYEAEMQVSLDIVEALRPYLHKIDLSSLKGEISHKYDTDNSPYLLWGKRKGENGMSADQIAMELESQGIHIDAINEADIFFEIDSQYRNAIKHLKTKAKDILSESLSKQELHDLRQDIAKEVLRGFDYTGDSSKLAKIVDKYKKQIATLNAKLKDSKAHNRAENRVLDRVQKIKDIKLGTFLNATQFKNNIFKGSIEKLSLIKNRGNLNESGTRRILAGLYEWYDKSNPILSYIDEKNTGLYNEEIASILQAISQNQKPLTTEQSDLIASLQEKSGISDYKGLVEWYTKEHLGKSYNSDIKSLLRELANETTFTTEELVGLEKVVGYFANLIENHNKVYRKGKYVEALPIVEEHLATMEKNKGIKVGWLSKIFDKVFNNTKWSYLETFSDPTSVVRKMDMYENGFYTEMLESLRRGAIDSAVMEMSIREELDSFLSKHKKFLKESSKKVVDYRGNQMPLYEAMLLYMTLNREQALGGLAYSGFKYEDTKGETVRVKGFTAETELTLVELVELAKAEQETLYKQFSEVEKEYISIAERIFNEQCKEAKRKTDMVRMGYSNVLEGYYIPIKRAYMAKNVDQHIYNDEINRASNPSFNKDTVKGAKGELFIEGLDSVLDRHIRAISQYANLSTVIDEYNVLYNLNTSGNPNNTTSIRTQSENVWKKGDNYFRELIEDIQGVPKQKGVGGRLVGFVRSGYAKYQLGANPKVWATQFSSLFAASSILDYSSIIKGLAVKTADVDEYCNLAKLRNNDDSAARAQGVLDPNSKTGKVLDSVNGASDFLMKPIGLFDRVVVKKLFGACQIQVEKDNGLKVGTVENKTKAGELLERVILETQQNSLATERSAAMRSGNELMKTITMFTADSMKVVGRVIDSVGEVSVLKAKIKQETDPQIKKSLEEKLKKANKKARKSITALGATSIFMALVAQGFRWLYNKDDEEDNIPLNMTVDAIGNLMGGLPIIKEIYSKLVEGYDLDNYAYSAFNDLFDAFKAILDDEGKPAQQVKNVVNAIGQIFGIPTRNVYNFLYGITNRISPSTGYLIDNAFYNQNYSSDLAKAIENEDEDMIATIVGIMLNERVGSIQDSKTQKELNALVVKGFEVLPKSIGKTITYNGEEITLTSKQKEQFKKVYSKANETLASLVKGKYYESATDEVRAKAIKFIYDIYYNLAIEDLLGVDLETKNILFAKAVDIPSLAIIVATARELESDKDKNGKTISGSKKAKVQSYINSLKLNATQKYMIMGYLGYTNKYGASQVKRYIQSLSLTTSQKELLYEYSGYTN